jgi:hypothetical protein
MHARERDVPVKVYYPTVPANRQVAGDHLQPRAGRFARGVQLRSASIGPRTDTSAVHLTHIGS